MSENKPLNCNLQSCIDLWKSFGGKSQREEDDNYENAMFCSKGNIGLQHCANLSCHKIYWRGYEGTRCANCYKKICSSCSKKEGRFDDEDQYYCPDC